MSDFQELSIDCNEEFKAILIAELGFAEFDTFQENETGLKAYIPTVNYKAEIVDEILTRYKAQIERSSVIGVEKENWNKKWEENFQPIFVDNKCMVRASFHESQSLPYEIIINPKMSFGTGHHATTHLMLSQIMKLDLQGKTVYDLGCGTGILAIMAHKLGAVDIEGNDVDDWCLENSKENFALNQCSQINIKLGSVGQMVNWSPKDVVLANINKNVLLQEMSDYANLLNTKGLLMLSGFYQKDKEDLIKQAQKFGLSAKTSSTKDDWACLLLEKA